MVNKKRTIAGLMGLALAFTLVGTQTAATTSAQVEPITVTTTTTTPEGFRLVTTETTNPDGTGTGGTTIEITPEAMAQAGQMAARTTAPVLTEADIEHYFAGDWNADDAGPQPGEAGTAAQTADVAAPLPSKYTPVPRPYCWSGTYAEDGDVHTRACAVFARKRKFANGDSLMRTRVLGSAYSEDKNCWPGCSNVNKYQGRTWWGNGLPVKWSPSRTYEDQSSCYTQSTSFTYRGATSSQEHQVCPDHFGPYGLDDDGTGSVWAGKGLTSGDPGTAQYRDVSYVHLMFFSAYSTGSIKSNDHVYWT